MLYQWLYPLHEQFILFNVIKYITFRTFMGIFTAFILVMAFGKTWIRFMQNRRWTQTLWEYVPQTHHDTKGKTPTMGGILILLAIFASSLLWANLENPFVWMLLAIGLAFGLLGLVDDYRKIAFKDAHGLRARYKFPLQVLICTLFAVVLYDVFDFDTHLFVPFFKGVSPDLGLYYIPFAVFVLVGTANAVNLTDGLDGLVTGPGIISFVAFGVLSYIAGNLKIANYLQLPNIMYAGELAVVCGCIAGALLGFLWFNSHPAQIFMGDVGSLSLGGMLGLAALLSKNELLLAIIGGVFVLETLSVITQVASYKLTGKRIFKMAPLHHHFELKGWPESKVIVRFWIVSILLALISLATLKLR
ncbi:MAG: phospho-N-acetylmuramoyl-pentapeptide-transferase [Deltaproteobacteria bacterium]|nr:phospho-N-acetylmuramoyl-pentapeptide-transferase [Deltaproteobacteria bacterium]